MRATTAIFDVISFEGAGMTSKTVVTKPDVRKSGPSDLDPRPQDCFGGGRNGGRLGYTRYR